MMQGQVVTGLCGYKGDTWEIELDGAKKVYVNVSVVEEYGLKKGQTLTAAALGQITDADILRKAKKRALYLIGGREMCRGELLKRLTKTYGAEIAEEAADYVCELGYVNDEEYAPKLAEYLIKHKRWGVRRVRYEMIMRGLDRELVENTLADVPEEELDEELITLIERQYINKIADYDDRRRTIAALARRGYGFGEIKRCIETVLESIEDDDYNEFDEE